MASAARIIDGLPASRVGEAVMSTEGDLFAGTPSELEAPLTGNTIWFRRGRLGGALPQVKGTL